MAVLPGREDLLAALHEAQGEQDPTAWEQVFATVEGVLARYEGEERSEDCWKALEEGLAADEKALRNRFQEHTRRHGAEQPFRVTDAVDWTPAGWMGNERELRVEHLAEQERVEAEAKETLRGAEQGRTRQWERIRQAQAVAERLEVLKGQQEKLGEGEAAPEEQAAQDAEREVAARREAETDARKRLAPLEEALGEAQRTAQARRKEAQAKHAEAVEQRKSAEALIARLRKEVGVLKGDPGICPTCKQPWAAHAQEIAQALQGKEDALGEAQKQLEAAKEAVVRCTEALDKAQGEDTQALEKAKAGVAEAQREVQEAAKARGDAERALGGVAQALKAAKERDARRVRLEGQLEESRAQAQAAKEAVAGDPAGTQAEQRESAAREAIGEAVKRRQEIERALARAGAWREAQAMVAGVDATRKAKGVVDPKKGLRGRRIEEGAQRLQRTLERFGERIGLGEYAFDARTLSVTCNGRQVDRGASSEQWLARTVVRLALAATHKVPLVVVDGADELTAGVRAKLRAIVGDYAKKTGVGVLWTEAVEESTSA